MLTNPHGWLTTLRNFGNFDYHVESGVTPSHSWFYQPTPAEQFDSGPNCGFPALPMTFGMRLAYLMELGFWTSCAVYLRWEKKRKDFYVMLTHHVVAIGLLSLSYLASNFRVGLLTLIVHDIPDVWLYSAKSLHYSKGVPKKILDMAFLLFVITFFVFRLILFPILCCGPIVDSAVQRFVFPDQIEWFWEMPCGGMFAVWMWTLYCMHCYWWHLIVKMVIKTLKVKSGE